MLIYISIDYDEGESSSYRAVVVSFNDDEHRFETNDPTKDWRSAVEYVGQLFRRYDTTCVMLSSCDHFVFDCPYHFESNDNLVSDKNY